MRMFGIIFVILFSMRMFYFGYSLFYENDLFLFLFFSVFSLYIFFALSYFLFYLSGSFVLVPVKQVMGFLQSFYYQR